MIEDYVRDRDVILIGGGPKIYIPEIENLVVVRVNSHHQYQEALENGPKYTDICFFGGTLPGLIAGFMNVPPTNLKYLFQNAAGATGRSMETWAKWGGVEYEAWGSLPAEKLERGIAENQWEPRYKPLIEICSQPFTGTIALCVLSKLPFNKLYLTGFDFFKDEKGPTRGEHNLEENRAVFSTLCKDPRIEPDPYVSEYLR